MPIIAPADNFLDAVALAFREFPGSCIPDSTDIGAHALELGGEQLGSFPLGRQAPEDSQPAPQGQPRASELQRRVRQGRHGFSTPPPTPR